MQIHFMIFEAYLPIKVIFYPIIFLLELNLLVFNLDLGICIHI
jgi:hypothetical protein